jgi:hypothetical protein
MNTGGQNGNAWETQRLQSVGELASYNLGKPDGTFTGNPGTAADAAVILTGSSGSHTFSQILDFSAFATAPNSVSGYDYIAIGFTRDTGASTNPAVLISNISLSVPGGEPILQFMKELPANDPDADPELDGILNIFEYAFGGHPLNAGDQDVLPMVSVDPSGMEFTYRRRLDAASRGLTYTVRRSADLQAGSWTTAGVSETGTATIDAEFESVTTGIQQGESVFVHLKVELSE